MNKYESIIIVTPKAEDQEIKTIIEKIKEIINTNNGSITKVEELGKRKFAYEIQKYKEGYYVLFEFEADSSVISKIERYYRITEDIIKFLTVKKDD